MIKRSHNKPISVLFLMIISVGFAQSDPILIDFSGESAEDNGIILMGAGFGAFPMPDVSFGSIPTDNAFEGATDGQGVIIEAGPGEGVMILGEPVTSSNTAFIRCSVRASASHISVYLASVDQGNNQFVSTITPNNGAFFENQYKRISNFVIPPASAFQPIVQVLNTSQTDPLTVYIDNFEFHILEPGKYYSAEFIDGNESDPVEIAITPFIPSPTPVPTSTPTPEPTATNTPTNTPTPTSTPTPTATPTPANYGMIHFHGTVIADGNWQYIPNAKVTISGDTIEDHVVYTDIRGQYKADLYGYYFDFYQITVEMDLYYTYRTLSAYNPNIPQDQLNNVTMLLVPGPAPTPTFTPPDEITVDLGDLPDGAKELKMVWIPPGQFNIGSPDDELGRSEDEHQQSVTITRGFYMGRYEITQAQYGEILGSNPSETVGNNYPVEKVSWIEAQHFIDELNKKELGTFRLPTEAEWEYAARAGTTTRYYWGDDPLYTQIDDYCWYDKNSGGVSHEVGMKTPNAWGLYDMLGNVFEWCQDYYAEYPTGPLVNPTGPETGVDRVRRGGSWLSYQETCRAAKRGQLTNFMRSKYLGFRIVKEH